jgi:F1-F0 ATPase (N-ATPase) AtpR subunit
MTNWYFTGHDLLLHLLGASVGLAIGALIGAFHFRTLQWNVQMFVVGGSLLLGSMSQLARFAFIACLLAAIARQFGALPLLAATAGILAVRSAVLQLGAR